MMKRKWTDMHLLEPKIIKLREAGKTRKEIAEELGLNKVQIKNWINRYNKRENSLIITNQRGRPRKNPMVTNRDLEFKIERLEREVELLRSFLHAAGRK